jgi:hypothetical protein
MIYRTLPSSKVASGLKRVHPAIAGRFEGELDNLPTTAHVVGVWIVAGDLRKNFGLLGVERIFSMRFPLDRAGSDTRLWASHAPRRGSNLSLLTITINSARKALTIAAKPESADRLPL